MIIVFKMPDLSENINNDLFQSVVRSCDVNAVYQGVNGGSVIKH